jgi:ABC-type molybdate transport system substrate-binding protein
MKLGQKMISLFLIVSLTVLGLFVYSGNFEGNKVAKGQGDVMSSLVDIGNGKFRYQITNQTDEDVTFHFTSSQRFDYAVKTEDGEQVFLFSSVALFMAVLGEETLKPEEELNYDIDLAELDLEKGKYILEVWFTPTGKEKYKVVMDYMVQ